MPPFDKPCPLEAWLKDRPAQDLVRASGVNHGSLSEFLRRIQCLSRESLHRLADATGIPYRALLLWQEGLDDAPAAPAPKAAPKHRKTSRSTHKRAGRAA